MQSLKLIQNNIPLFFIAILCASLIVISCTEEKPDLDSEKYKGWKTYNFGNFKFHISPDSEWFEKMDALKFGYNRYLREICGFLEMPVPEDTIIMYIYAMGAEDTTITGRVTPYSNDTEIHWGNKYSYGHELTKFLLRKRGVGNSRFSVMSMGIPSLFDFSSKNYHDKANRYVNSDVFISLSDLGINEIFDTANYVYKRAESASFCGFVLYHYGLDKLLLLHEAILEWPEAVESTLQMSLEDIEKNWLAFAREHTDFPDGTIDNDPAKDMKMIQKILK